MPAAFIPSPGGDLPHLLRLPPWEEAGDAAAEVQDALLLRSHLQGPVALLAGRWPLRWGDFRRLMALLEPASLALVRVSSLDPGARVAAAALGLAVDLGREIWERDDAVIAVPSPTLSIHQGTLRSGDHRQVEGALLVLGDVNAGAQIRATGHVLVWGRLRGTVHAGCMGDRAASIVALHLHPLQLRIADQVARGPAEPPPSGLAERAHLVNGRIQIDPAEPLWPLAAVPARLPGQEGTRRASDLH